MQQELEFHSPKSITKKNIEFRDYQREAIDLVIKGDTQNAKTQLIVLPTATGKTIVMSGVADHFLKNVKKRVLILAHRQELLEQAQEKIAWVVGNEHISEIEMASQKASAGDIVLASVQTIGRSNSARIQKFDPNDFGLVIIDEAHHSIAATYQNVIDYFRQNKNLLLVGVTATNKRTDEESLAGVFEKITYQDNVGYDKSRMACTLRVIQNIFHNGSLQG